MKAAPNDFLPQPLTIRTVPADQTYALRHAVLWPTKPLAYVQLPDDARGQHFGAFVGEQLVAVLSLFVEAGSAARFRKFATAPEWQGRGIGTALLQHVMEAARAHGATALWCDARQNTLPFYRRFGLEPEGGVFYKDDSPYRLLRCALD